MMRRVISRTPLLAGLVEYVGQFLELVLLLGHALLLEVSGLLGEVLRDVADRVVRDAVFWHGECLPLGWWLWPSALDGGPGLNTGPPCSGPVPIA